MFPTPGAYAPGVCFFSTGRTQREPSLLLTHVAATSRSGDMPLGEAGGDRSERVPSSIVSRGG